MSARDFKPDVVLDHLPNERLGVPGGPQVRMLGDPFSIPDMLGPTIRAGMMRSGVPSIQKAAQPIVWIAAEFEDGVVRPVRGDRIVGRIQGSG